MPARNTLSVVVPAYNEAENIPLLVEEVHSVLSHLNQDWEILVIDDCSTDETLPTLKNLAKEHPELRYLSFERNCGQSAGFSAGFKAARGDIIITMDADLQNDPADIPLMLKRFEQGADMVIGWRASRQDSRIKRIASLLANRIRNALTRESVRDTGCSLKILRADMARRIPMFTGMHRFLPTLMRLEGARVVEIKVNHRPRRHGKSKYGVLDRALTTWQDLLAVRWMQKRHIQYVLREHN